MCFGGTVKLKVSSVSASFFGIKVGRSESASRDRQYVLGKVFYSVSKFLNIDIDHLCIKVFKDYKWLPLFNDGEFQTKIQAFIYPYVNSSNTISAAAGIEKTRFSRLQKGELEELYADEVYGLAKAFSLKPSQLFDYFLWRW